MFEWDKNLTAEAFSKPAKENNEGVILVTTDAYGIDIDNPDVKLVIQWDILLLFDSMIQRMRRAGKKGRASAFILLTPKQTRSKDSNNIEKRRNDITSTSANAQLSDSNRPKAFPKTSSLSQLINVEDKLSDLEAVAKSEGDFELDEEADLFSGMLASDADQNQKQRKKELKANEIDDAKRAKPPNQIFDYIHVARYRRLFSLPWYDDLTYAQSNDSSILAVALPTPCCNGPSCSSTELSYTQRECFIDRTTTKITKANGEWIAYRTLALKKWKTKIST